MSPVNVEERLGALREQARRREVQPDAWPRLQRRLRREPWRRAALVVGLALAVLVAGVVPGLLARRAGQPPVPTVDEPVAPGRPVVAARIRLDRPFTDVDVGFGATWVASQGALLRIDPRTNRVVATIRIPNGVLMAFGLGTLWLAQDASSTTSGGNEPDQTRPGRLYRVDPQATGCWAGRSLCRASRPAPWPSARARSGSGNWTARPSPASTWPRSTRREPSRRAAFHALLSTTTGGVAVWLAPC